MFHNIAEKIGTIAYSELSNDCTGTLIYFGKIFSAITPLQFGCHILYTVYRVFYFVSRFLRQYITINNAANVCDKTGILDTFFTYQCLDIQIGGTNFPVSILTFPLTLKIHPSVCVRVQFSGQLYVIICYFVQGGPAKLRIF